MLVIKEYEECYVKEISDIIIQNLIQINSKDYTKEEINKMCEKFSIERLKDTLSNRKKVYIALINNELVGTAGIDKSWYRDDEYYILTVFVKPCYHGKGIGKKLIEAIEDFAYTLPIKKLVIPSSIPAHKFYFKLGYKYKNNKKEVNEEGMYIMEKYIKK